MMARIINADAVLDRYYAEFEQQDICDGWEDRDWLMKCLTEAPAITQPTGPLTLHDLRKIDTVTQLWVHNLSWGQHKPRLMLVRYVASNYWSCVDFDGFEIVKADDYGSRYLIYCHPPEGGENDGIS